MIGVPSGSPMTYSSGSTLGGGQPRTLFCSRRKATRLPWMRPIVAACPTPKFLRLFQLPYYHNLYEQQRFGNILGLRLTCAHNAPTIKLNNYQCAQKTLAKRPGVESRSPSQNSRFVAHTWFRVRGTGGSRRPVWFPTRQPLPRAYQRRQDAAVAVAEPSGRRIGTPAYAFFRKDGSRSMKAGT